MNLGRLAVCRSCRTWHSRRWPRQSWSRRSFSSALGSTAPTLPSPTPIAALASLKDDLDRIAPKFYIQASQVLILKSPAEFYETLKSKILAARTRIYLTTLYIGKTEHELVSTIRSALLQNPDLKVYFLADALRGTRETPESSCTSLLAPLVEEFGPERVEIRLYHTPNLTGLRKRITPKRINEGWGLQHMKLYGIDDEVVISGANLSHDYFTNRQDRYHVFASRQISDYFATVHRTVSDLSYLVLCGQGTVAGYRLHWPKTNIAPSPLENPSEFITSAATALNPLIKPTATISQRPTEDSHDTVVYPLAQMSPLLRPDTSTEYPALVTLLRHLATNFAHSRWIFTAGYFNIRPELRALLLASRCDDGVVVTASPWANGFYGSKGISGLLPAAYTLLSRRFLESVQHDGRGDQIELQEWRRGTIGEPNGWTYHAKGLWVTLPGELQPSITLVGSSNYTKRSYSLDLEMNVLVMTRSEDLKRRLGEEQSWLKKYARRVELDDFMTPERRVGLHVRIAMGIVSLLGGAL